jgi:hypothetical protein
LQVIDVRCHCLQDIGPAVIWRYAVAVFLPNCNICNDKVIKKTSTSNRQLQTYSNRKELEISKETKIYRPVGNNMPKLV